MFLSFDHFHQYIQKNWSDLLLWYCYAIGLFGNTLTLALLLARILNFKRNLIKPRKLVRHQDATDENDEKTSIQIHKSDLVDRRNNWTLYYYIIGIVISDLFVLLSWIVSKTSIQVKFKSNVDYVTLSWETSAEPKIFEKEPIRHLLRQTDYAYLFKSFSFVNSTYSLLDVRQVFPDHDDSFVFLDSVVSNFNNHLRFSSMLLMDVPGMCQIYYYFSIISMQGSFSFTIACLLDRIVKLKVISNEISSNKSDLNPYLELEYTAKKGNGAEETELSKTPKKASPSTYKLIKSTDLKSLTKPKYSEIVKQLFGKTSTYFIALFVFLFYFHLLWIYASVPVEESDELGFYPAFLLNNNSNNVQIVAQNRTFYSIKASTTKPQCRLISNNNSLVYYVMNIDMFLLLMFCVIKLFLAVGLIYKYLVTRKQRQRALSSRVNSLHTRSASIHFKTRKKTNMKNIEVNVNMSASLLHKTEATAAVTSINNCQASLSPDKKEKKRHCDRYVFLNCVLSMSILGVLCELPSVVIRNFFMMFMLFSSQLASNPSTSLQQHNSTTKDIDQNFLYNSSSFSNSTSYYNNQSLDSSRSTQTTWFTEDILSYTEGLSRKTDLVLLIFSSHKFFLIVLSLNLIKIPRICGWLCVR